VSKERIKMPVSDRAKQFSPFAAIRGLEEALAEKEKIPVPRPEYSEEMNEKINKKLCRLKKGEHASVKYYGNEEFLWAEGVVEKIDTVGRVLKIGDIKISFDDILNIG